MVIRYSTALLNKFLAPGISNFTSCNAPDISETHPEARHWLTNHFLNSFLRGTFENNYRQYIFNLVFRAQVAFADYHEARLLTFQFLAKGTPDNPASRAYFLAVARWESCLLNLQIFIDVMNKLKKELGDAPVFAQNDGTAECRAYKLANVVKHFGGDIHCNRHADTDTIPLWLTNSSLKTRTYELTYQDLATLISEIAAEADLLQDPKSFFGSGAD